MNDEKYTIIILRMKNRFFVMNAHLNVFSRLSLYFDCVTAIVISSALEYCLDVEKLNLSAIRTVRVLRPLRAINRIPSKLLLYYSKPTV